MGRKSFLKTKCSEIFHFSLLWPLHSITQCTHLVAMSPMAPALAIMATEDCDTVPICMDKATRTPGITLSFITSIKTITSWILGKRDKTEMTPDQVGIAHIKSFLPLRFHIIPLCPMLPFLAVSLTLTPSTTLI